jgi:aspartate/methionine/tyrosine aminotransferase
MTAVSGAHPGSEYPMNKWVFEDTPGRFDVDLSHSYVQGRRLSDLTVPYDLELDYGADRGTAELREEIAQLYRGSAESVLVTHGGQEALALLYSILLKPGDQVITFRPGWRQSWDTPALMGCQVDVMPLSGDFDIDVDAVAAAATSRLRIIVVVSPCNPTGRRARAATLERLVEILERSDGYLVLDQNYESDLTPPVAGSDRVLSVSGLSKVYGFPGLRIGWMYGPEGLVRACGDRKHLTSISNSVLCEALACEVLRKSEYYLTDFHAQVAEGLEILQKWVSGQGDLLRLTPPEDTPFAWIELLDGSDSMAFCRQALDRGVLLMPAETLGGTSAFRLGMAIPPAELRDGLNRLEDMIRARHISNGAF